ncbi:MAG: PilZ domain-containing protein [Candidatus Omnitrophota bacterium]
MVENRKYKRFDISLKIKYKIDGWNQQYLCTTKNIGGDGVCIVVDSGIKENTKLELEFSGMEEEDPIIVRAEAVWTREVSSENDDLPFLKPGGMLLPWQSPYVSPVGGTAAAAKKIYEVGLKFIGIRSGMIVKLLRYIGSSFTLKDIQKKA